MSYVILVITRASGRTRIYLQNPATCLITVKYVKTLYMYQICVIMLEFYFLEMSGALCFFFFCVNSYCFL
jgi:hypothetical protein